MVKRWQPAKVLRDPKKSKCTILVVGKRNRGKSTLMVDLVRHIPCPKAIVLSATDKCSHFYEQYFPSHFIYDKYDPDFLSKIISVQKRLVGQNPDMRVSGLVLIIDDTGFDKKFLRSKQLFEIVCNGRWYNIALIIGVQDAGSITPPVRSQMDYVCSLAESFRNGQERLYNWFYGVYPTFKDFRTSFAHITQDYGVMVLDNVSKSTDLQESIYWHKADPRVKFKFGSAQYKKHRA
tara:strand:- start:6998 stop:7702 length:705 start_codon:yes stop_codon:yes gene_type:complete